MLDKGVARKDLGDYDGGTSLRGLNEMVRRMDGERLKKADFGRVQVRLHNDADKIAHHWFQETDPKLYRRFLLTAEQAILPVLDHYLQVLKDKDDTQPRLLR